MDDKVQLSRETIVGDSVVNEDIYPNTDTDSVNDEQSGTNLTETIERIWAAINNKLARIVNSVNGRTGVVVLDASDVGLENVDNVSFNDIKQWVLDELTKVFGYKKIKLFDTSSDLNVCITQNNFDDLYSPFYVAKWNTTTDTRPYIGCIILDPHDPQHIAYEVKPINGIGMTDDSLVYKDTDSDQTLPGMKGGELRVNISPEEDALYVYHDSEDPTKSGLKLDHSLIGGILRFYDGIYGDMVEDPSNPGHYTFEHGLISAITPSELSPLPTCKISIDGNELGDFYLADTAININDTIVCNFRDYRSNAGDKWTLSSEKIYIKNEYDEEHDKWSYEWSGDRYRVGDILDIASNSINIKFIVTAIKDGMFEGPVAAVDLLYCQPVDDNGKLTPSLYETKPIIRYMDPTTGNQGFPPPVDWTLTKYISIQGTTTAEGCQIYIADNSYWIKAQYQTPEDTDFKLMKRGMCIGRVTSAPNRLDPHAHYAIDFNSIRPLVGNSLQFKTYDKQFHADKLSEVLDIKTRKGHFDSNGLINDPIDVSGIAVTENWGEYREDGNPARIVDSDGNSMVEPNRIKRAAVMPDGVRDVMDNSQATEGGLTVMTDMSLCLIPHKLCAKYSARNTLKGSAYAVNWSASLPYVFPTYEKDQPSYVGVNLFKVVKPFSYVEADEDDIYKNQKYFFNMSGLRVINKNTKTDYEMFGKTSTDKIVKSADMDNDTFLNYPASGGLMVNVGPGLEISGWYRDGSENEHDFDDGGKVSVRVDDETIAIDEKNRLAVKYSRGLTTLPVSGVNTKHLTLDIDNITLGFNNNKLKVAINDLVYHDVDMMSNKHPVVNMIKTQSPTGQDLPVSAYVDTKYGLGLTLSGNVSWGHVDGDVPVGSPNALMIRIKASDVGDTTSDNKSVYRQKLVSLKTDSLMFDPDGKLISPIDTSRGLTNTYVAKAISSDSSGNVTVREEGGLAIKTGAGLTFDKDGCLTLEADYEIKAIKNGFDLNNLSSGNYYATAAVSTSLSHLPVNDVGVFRVEMKPVIPDDNYYIQKLYSFEKKGIVYIRYKVNGTWTAWYHIDGSIID